MVGRRAALPLVALLLGAGCGAHTEPHPPGVLAATQRAATENGVRAFMHRIAADVSREGPAAWRREFSDGPEFFMAANGLLVFADGAAAARGIEALTHTLPKIELAFGDDLRVDALTPALAMIGSSYTELQTDERGLQHTDRGYVSGLAEFKAGQWRLRSAHWSSRP
jgi:hypothetical protein